MTADRVVQIPFSRIREIFEECGRLEAGADVVHLEIGRPDFDTSQPIEDAAVERRPLVDGDPLAVAGPANDVLGVGRVSQSTARRSRTVVVAPRVSGESPTGDGLRTLSPV